MVLIACRLAHGFQIGVVGDAFATGAEEVIGHDVDAVQTGIHALTLE